MKSYSRQILMKLDTFSTNTKNQISRKIRPQAAELFHAEGRKGRKGGREGGKEGRGHTHTHTTKLMVAFHNFANEPTFWHFITH